MLTVGTGLKQLLCQERRFNYDDKHEDGKPYEWWRFKHSCNWDYEMMTPCL